MPLAARLQVAIKAKHGATQHRRTFQSRLLLCRSLQERLQTLQDVLLPQEVKDFLCIVLQGQAFPVGGETEMLVSRRMDGWMDGLHGRSSETQTSPLVGVQYEDQLVFTEVLRHPERLDLCKAVSQHLANARLSDRQRGQRGAEPVLGNKALHKLRPSDSSILTARTGILSDSPLL